jgi:hypothetical protein
MQWVKGRRDTPCGGVSEYAFDQLECKGLVDVLELVEIADALRYPTDGAPKIAVTRPDASWAAGTCACVVASGGVIDLSSSCSNLPLQPCQQ